MFGHGIKYRGVYRKKVSFLHPLVPKLLPGGKRYFLSHMYPFGDITYVCVYICVCKYTHTEAFYVHCSAPDPYLGYTGGYHQVAPQMSLHQ